MKIKFIEIIYSKGTADSRGDGLINNEPFFGVVDGMTTIPAPHEPPPLFEGEKGEEVVRKIISSTFYSARNNETLSDVIRLANKNMASFAKTHDLPLDRADLLPGASFVLTKINEDFIEIIQGGDCLAVWQNSKGKLGATDIQTFEYDQKNKEVIAELMKKYEGNREKMWKNYYATILDRRRLHINSSGFAILNGQNAFEKYWQKIKLPLNDIKLLILSSDGLIPSWEESRPSKKQVLAQKITSAYHSKRFSGMLSDLRTAELKNKSNSYLDHHEVTALAINFSLNSHNLLNN